MDSSFQLTISYDILCYVKFTALSIQYPDHIRTAASNVAISMPPPPIL